ncbi:cation:proton antiporter [Thermosipho melanesiensis]|uniref:Na+/H+ antiporter MnhB subunit-related protein n=2 Tax=Thermosipho melanesiensis TaxID=46541 RepID=A6LMV2_THEM4|nr:Na(+)/H(+) antiporter subunit B [Thermosipho melanesiensis]ABR31253.1 Na+/H+ antiporter MnhB subunit-related protein [Thermosipho melanesiensis BI429]APT74337.1 cation:proton antiporter [Thermosipho melanesiensis]OOC36277.1 cation:proton antiporter [Thermosipho melanesiensis]OOC37095.1 cation:proton antiporter [Thermosipho melanesiensis]OOC37847.1 cation:proton antiporter [Thermosipho melanesiensis]
MAWIKVLSLILISLLFFLFLFQRGDYDVDFKNLGAVNNFVTEIYLRNRLYDTIFEVLVFSLAALGIFLFNYSIEKKEIILHESHIRMFLKFLSYFVILTSFYLAYFGHKTPGGGFSAGVAGGTGLLLYSLSTTINEFEYMFNRFKVKIIEKWILIVIYLISIVALFGSSYIAILNILIYLKVMFGTWIILYSFVKHRGII